MKSRRMHRKAQKAFCLFCILNIFWFSGCTSNEGKQQVASLPKPPKVSTETIKVACVGDSITYGSTLQKRTQENYPYQLQQLLGKGVQVKNFGVDGAAAQKQAMLSYWNCKEYQNSLAYQPDVIFLMLGTNDTKVLNWHDKKQFKKDYLALLHSYQKQLPTVKIYVMLPSTMYSVQADGSLIHGFSQENMEQVLSAIHEISEEKQLPLIDIHQATAKHAMYYQYDGIHPNAQGAKLIAETVAAVYLQDSAKEIISMYVNWEIKAGKVLLQIA